MDSGDAPWLRFVTRSAVLTAVTLVASFAAFFAGVGFDPSVPQEYAELVGASRRLAAYRVSAVLDVLVWLTIGATLLAFAGLFARRAAVRAALLAACAAGQLVGALGGYLRLNATSDLAARYAAAAADRQAALVQAYLTVAQLVMAHYGTGQLLYGVGYLSIGSVALSLVGFPRWLAVWFAVSGAWAVVAQVVSAAGSTFFMALFLLYAVAGIIALHLATATAFWRRAGGLAPAVVPPAAAAMETTAS